MLCGLLPISRWRLKDEECAKNRRRIEEKTHLREIDFCRKLRLSKYEVR